MHELAAAQDILSTALKEAERQNARRIVAIAVRIGQRSGFNPENVRDLLEAVGKGTIAEGARLEAEVVPGAALAVASIEIE